MALGYQAEEKYLTGLLELFGARSSAQANSDRLLQATRSLCRICAGAQGNSTRTARMWWSLTSSARSGSTSGAPPSSSSRKLCAQVAVLDRD